MMIVLLVKKANNSCSKVQPGSSRIGLLWSWSSQLSPGIGFCKSSDHWQGLLRLSLVRVMFSYFGVIEHRFGTSELLNIII